MTTRKHSAALLIAATLLSVFALPTASTAASQDPQQSEADARAMYEGLRGQALSTSAAEIGVPGDKPAYGVLMEFLLDGETITVVAFATGDGSVYFSPGGGMIGGIDVPVVAEAARTLVTAAGEVAADLPKVETFPRPEGEEIQFYILTPDGVRRGSAMPDVLETGQDRLSPLFIAGVGIITGFRTNEQAQ